MSRVSKMVEGGRSWSKLVPRKYHLRPPSTAFDRLRLAALVFALTAEPAVGQRWLTLDAGGGALTHQFAPASQAVTLSPRLAWLGPRAHLLGGALYSRGTELRWNAEGDLAAGVAAPLGRHWTFALDGAGVWTSHHRGDGTGEIQLQPSLRFEAPAGSVRFSLGQGLARTSIGNERFAAVALAAASQVGPFEVRGRVSRTAFTRATIRATEIWIPNGPQSDTALRRYLNNFDDLELRAAWTRSRLRLEGGLLRRLGAAEGFQATGWHVQATGWLRPNLAVFAASGRTLSRLTVDLPARRYTTVGLRWLIASSRGAAPKPASAAPARSFRAERQGSEVRLFMPALGAETVEIMGDFTNWEPVPMQPQAGGWWVWSQPLAPGLHRVNVRIDGAEWRVPPGLPAQEDDLGGRSGIVLIP